VLFRSAIDIKRQVQHHDLENDTDV